MFGSDQCVASWNFKMCNIFTYFHGAWRKIRPQTETQVVVMFFFVNVVVEFCLLLDSVFRSTLCSRFSFLPHLTFTNCVFPAEWKVFSSQERNRTTVRYQTHTHTSSITLKAAWHSGTVLLHHSTNNKEINLRIMSSSVKAVCWAALHIETSEKSHGQM